MYDVLCAMVVMLLYWIRRTMLTISFPWWMLTHDVIHSSHCIRFKFEFSLPSKMILTAFSWCLHVFLSVLTFVASLRQQQRWSSFCVAWITPHTRAAFQCWNLLLPPLSSLCELQRRLLVAHRWHGSDNDLLMGKDAACPVYISMTPAGRSTTAPPRRALLMLLPDDSLYPPISPLSLYVAGDISYSCCALDLSVKTFIYTFMWFFLPHTHLNSEGREK